MHNKARDWLARVPVGEGEQRGARALQTLLLLIGVLVPLFWGLRLGIGQALRGIEWTCLVAHTGMAVLAGISFVCVRLGRFRLGGALFLAGCLVLIPVIYALNGLRGPGPLQVIPVLPLALAGLLFGRRALWATLAFTWGCVLLGAALERIGGTGAGVIWEVAIGLMTGFLVVAVVLDSTLAGLQAHLLEVEERHRELEQARRSLKAEKEEREHTMDQLVHVQKVKAIGQLAGGVAHDFNNILGVILGYAQWRDRHAGMEPLREALAGVEAAARRGAAISRKLLNFSRQDVAHPEVFDLCEALGGLESMLRQLFDPRVRIELALPATNLPVRADRGQLELAVLNVASNARDAMPEGGRFRLAVEAVRDERGRSLVEILLSDTGEGMEEDVRRRIFEPFFTTKSQSSGTGLGLAVVGKVIHEAGGEILVDSTPGAGSCFRLRLPAPVAPPALSDGAPPRVLLVDDDDELRSMLARTLERGGCRVLGARDGREAWRVIVRGGVPDVLVTDYRMPGLDGLALIRRLRPLYPDLAMVLISDYLPEAAELARDLPPDVERLPKPISPDLLMQYVFMLTTSPEKACDEGEGG